MSHLGVCSVQLVAKRLLATFYASPWNGRSPRRGQAGCAVELLSGHLRGMQSCDKARRHTIWHLGAYVGLQISNVQVIVYLRRRKLNSILPETIPVATSVFAVSVAKDGW